LNVNSDNLSGLRGRDCGRRRGHDSQDRHRGDAAGLRADLRRAGLIRALEVVTLLDQRGWDESLELWRGAPLSDEGNAPWVSAWRESQRMRLAAASLAAADQPGHLARRPRGVVEDPGLGAYL
jgi:hypothetical protein